MASTVEKSSAPPSNYYHVFFSSRSDDTRKPFIALLYKELERKGFLCFKDNQKLGREKSTQAIESSRFAVVVITESYASSSLCLDELVKIIQWKETRGLSVLPIFYNVDPLEVKEQTGWFAQVFERHENDSSVLEKLQSWREALIKLAFIDGWNSRDW